MIDSSILSGVACFIIGFGSGYAACSIKGSGVWKNILNAENIVMSVIVIVWFISVLAGIFVSGYTTPMEIHAIMGLAAGYLYKKKRVRW